MKSRTVILRDPMSIRSEAQRAIERGVAYLDRRQLPTGELTVYAFRSGHSDRDPSVFPTALAAHSLSFSAAAHKVHQRALDFLAAEMDRRGLWRHWSREHPHHESIPFDLDDTSTASAALRSAGRAFPSNRALFLANRDSRGLFRTWKFTAAQLRHPLAAFLFFRNTSASPRDIDAVVNSNVLFYLGAIPETRPVVDHLMSVLRAKRETSCDKWYENPFAIHYFFSRALADIEPEASEIIVTRARGSTPANALEMALAACTLLNCNQIPDIEPLLAAQLESGGWPRAGLYHGGRARLPDDSFAPPHPDTPWWGSEELTTAFCIEALARWQSS